MTATLRQEFFLGAMPAGFELQVTQIKVHGARGYNVGWRDNSNFNLTKVVTECWSGGRSDTAQRQRIDHGTICTIGSSFPASIAANGQPVRLGEMTWQKSTQESAFNIFLAGEPGLAELKFQVSDMKSRKVVASGSLTAAPEKFHILQRPDNIKVKLVWDKTGQTKDTTTEIAPNIGVDPPAIHLMFAMGQDKKSLGMGFMQVQSTLNQVASLGVQLVVDVNKALLEWGVPGGAIIVTAIELPETVDTAIGLFDAGKDLVDALSSRNPGKAHLALMKIIKGGYDIGGVIMNIKGLKSDTAERVLKMIPPNAKDLAEGVLTKLLEEVVDKGIAFEDGLVNQAKLRHRNLARSGKGGRYRS
ncbi:hypothetical protein TWF281_004915 [Arthrobotrys megalospora]